MKGLFIPGITVEMFRNGCLESIEALMAEGEVYDIEYNKEPHWIPCTPETMPEEKEWMGTKRFGTTISDKVLVTFERPDGSRFVKELRFQNGKLSSFDQQSIDAFNRGSIPIRWKPWPEPYNPESEESE